VYTYCALLILYVVVTLQFTITSPVTGVPLVIVAVSAGTGIYFDVNDDNSNLFAVRHMGEVFL